MEEKPTGEEREKKKKRLRIITIGLVLILGILAGVVIVFHRQIFNWIKKEQAKPEKSVPPLGAETKRKAEFNFDWALWKDQAGFSFEYPRELEVNVHPEDEENYSFLTLTAKDRRGKINIICNDSPYKDIKEWLRKDSLVREKSALETQIASISGEKVALGGGREVSAFIDWDEVIYLIDKQPENEGDFWNPIYTRINSSFKLIPLEGESEKQFNEWLGDFDTSNVDIVEPVEVIE